MINLKHLVPVPVRHFLFAAFLFTGPAVAMNAYLEAEMNSIRASNNGLVDTYLAWDTSEAKDMAQLKPLFDKAKAGNAAALSILSVAQHRADLQLSLDEALIGFYRTAPDYMLSTILDLEYLYNPEKRTSGETIITALTADQGRSLTECAARLRTTSGRYDHFGTHHDDPSLSFWLKQQVSIINVLIDETGIRQSVCSDLPV